MQGNRRKRIVVGITMIIGGFAFAFVVRLLAALEYVSAVSPENLEKHMVLPINGFWFELSQWGTIAGLIVAAAGAVLAYVEWARWFIAAQPVSVTAE